MDQHQGEASNELTYAVPTDNDRLAPSRLDIAVLALRALGVYFAAQTLTVISAAPIFLQPGMFAQRYYLLLPYVFYGIVATVFLVWPTRWARMMLPPEGTGVMPATPGASDLQAMAFAVVGVVLVALAVPEILSTLPARGRSGSRNGISPDLLHPLVQCAIGAGLFLYARGLALLWRRLQGKADVEQSGRGPAE